MGSSTASSSKKEYTAIYLVLAILVTTFLSFIDEGNFNFNWIYNWGNWLVFIIYAIGIFSGQILAQHYLFRKLETVERIILSFMIGGAVGLATVILIFTLVLK